MGTSNPIGRPTVMTEAILGKLEEAFAYDATIEEACFYADINPDTYYTYVKTNTAFSERVKALRNQPVLAARKKVVEDIKSDTRNAQWYLERKRKNEFSVKTEFEGNIGINPVEAILNKYELTEGNEGGSTANQAEVTEGEASIS